MGYIHVLYDPNENLKTDDLPEEIKRAVIYVSHETNVEPAIIKLAELLVEQINA